MSHIRLLAATGTAVTALALTACSGNGTGTKDEGASRTDAPTAAATAGRTPTAAPGAATGGEAANSTQVTRTGGPATKPDGRRTTGKGTGTGTGASVVLCNGANTRVTAAPVTRPLNHMLITVTNTGSRICELPYYPVVRFDEMQWAPQAAKETMPQAVTTLRPGESGYAGVLLSSADGSGEGGTTGHKLTVMFQGRTPNSDGGPSATPVLPAKGVYYDSSLKVAYWQQNASDALDW
ncbi:lipoprotein [Streptomyces sp. MMG1121]|nr:lipoprotein [Streptomyces sp. MMG1121]